MLQGESLNTSLLRSMSNKPSTHSFACVQFRKPELPEEHTFKKILCTTLAKAARQFRLLNYRAHSHGPEIYAQ